MTVKLARTREELIELIQPLFNRDGVGDIEGFVEWVTLRGHVVYPGSTFNDEVGWYYHYYSVIHLTEGIDFAGCSDAEKDITVFYDYEPDAPFFGVRTLDLMRWALEPRGEGKVARGEVQVARGEDYATGGGNIQEAIPMIRMSAFTNSWVVADEDVETEDVDGWLVLNHREEGIT